MRNISLICVLLPAWLMAIPPPAPSGGVIEREIQQEYEAKPLPLEKDIPTVEVDIPEDRLSLPSGKSVLVRTVEIEGNKAVGKKEIQGWIKESVGKKLTIEEIYALCKTIDAHYALKGYFLTRCYPPPQEICNGTLVIRILEGRVGAIRVEGNKYYKTSFIKGYFERFCHSALGYDDFLFSLLLLNENSDLNAGVVFEKGKEVGTADLVIRVEDKRPIHLYLNENNYGRDLTTNSQLGGRFDWGNCLMQGDTFSLAEVVGFPVNALYFTDVIYTVPLNKRGTSMDFAFLFSKFHVEELLYLKLRGQSLIATVKAEQALKRTKTLGIDVFGWFDFKQIQNFVLNQRTSYDRLRVVTVGGLIDHYNSSRGRDYLNVRFACGIPDFLGGLSAVDNQSSRIGGGGRFYQFNADYDRIQQIYKEWLLYFHASGQYSPSKLTQPQQIYIGGSNTVRGYPLSVALGDSGYYVNVETRFPLPLFMDRKFFWSKKTWKEVLQIVGFLDTGGTFFNEGSRTFITGTGCGLRFMGPWTLAISFDVGFPLNRPDLSNSTFNYLKITAQAF
jgi:hemolysin activation/secretion protein